MQDELPQQHSNSGFVIALTIVGAMAICFVLMMKAGMESGSRPISAQLGKEFPPIEAAGWINGEAPSSEKLRGRVVVVDAWAFWCGPCRESTPEIINVYQKFKDQDVTFIGLTSEGENAKSLQLSRQYVQSLKIPWVNGYTAIKTLSALEVDSIPQLWVIDRQNQIVLHEIGWAENSPQELEHAIAKALAKK